MFFNRPYEKGCKGVNMCVNSFYPLYNPLITAEQNIYGVMKYYIVWFLEIDQICLRENLNQYFVIMILTLLPSA